MGSQRVRHDWVTNMFTFLISEQPWTPKFVRIILSATWSICICRPPTPTFLGTSILTMSLFPQIGWGEAWGHPASFEKCKPSSVVVPSSRMCRCHLKTDGVKPRTLVKPPFLWRRTWSRPFWVAMSRGFCPHGPPSSVSSGRATS